MEEFNLGGKGYKDQQILVFQCVPVAAAADIRNTQGLLVVIKSLNYLGTWPHIPHILEQCSGLGLSLKALEVWLESDFKDLLHVSIPSG